MFWNWVYLLEFRVKIGWNNRNWDYLFFVATSRYDGYFTILVERNIFAFAIEIFACNFDTQYRTEEL